MNNYQCKHQRLKQVKSWLKYGDFVKKKSGRELILNGKSVNWIQETCTQKCWDIPLSLFMFSKVLCSSLEEKRISVGQDKQQQKSNVKYFGFFYLMAYQLSWFTHCQWHPRRRTAVSLFNPYLGVVRGSKNFSNGIRPWLGFEPVKIEVKVP